MNSQENSRIGDFEPTGERNAGQGSTLDVAISHLITPFDGGPLRFVQGRPQLPWPLKVAYLALGLLPGCAKPVFLGNVGATIDSSGLVLLKKVYIEKPQDRWPGEYPLHDIASYRFSMEDEASLERAVCDLRWLIIKEGRYVNEPQPKSGQVPLDLAIIHHNKEILEELLRASAQGDFDLMVGNWAHGEIYEVLYFMISNNIELGHLKGPQFRNPMQWLADIGNHQYIAFALDVSPSNSKLLPQGYERRPFPYPPTYVNGNWADR